MKQNHPSLVNWAHVNTENEHSGEASFVFILLEGLIQVAQTDVSNCVQYKF